MHHDVGLTFGISTVIENRVAQQYDVSRSLRHRLRLIALKVLRFGGSALEQP